MTDRSQDNSLCSYPSWCSSKDSNMDLHARLVTNPKILISQESKLMERPINAIDS